MTFTQGWEGPKVYASQLGPQQVRADWTMPAPVTGIVPLRPLGVGDVLGGAFRAVRYSPPVMLGLTFAVVLVAQVVAVMINLAFGEALSGVLLPFSQDLGNFGFLSLRSLTTPFANLVAIVVASMGLIYTVVEAVAGRRATPQAALRHIGQRLGAALGLAALLAAGLLFAMVVGGAVLSSIGVAGGVLLFIFLVLPIGFVFNVKLLFIPCVISSEQMGPFQAVVRSWRLTTGVFWRTLGTYLLTLLIMWIPMSVISGVFFSLAEWAFMGDFIDPDSAAGMALTTAGSLLSIILTVPLITAVQTLLYVDARIRREGYDITLSEAMYG